ncbi:MAG TPA: hypothetical protein VN668_06895 [Stellaceae bacterium]|nr:hypothetical protein [Stellaceae bacterium]
MHRWLLIAALAVIASACSTSPEPDRLVFGVSGDRAAGTATAQEDAEMRRFLDAKLNQICTRGYDTVKVDTLAAEGGKQLVDEEARCQDYSFSLF